MPSFLEREATYGPIVRAAFTAQGLPGSWGMALARQESSFMPDAASRMGGDLSRGGSYGLCQVSMLTAQELGYHGDARGLFDPRTNATLAATLCRQLADSHGMDLREVAAAYNSGKGFANAPTSTRMSYVPRVLGFARDYAAQFPDSTPAE